MRQTSYRGFNARAKINPYRSWAQVIDCGDIPITPLDNSVALKQLSDAYMELGSRKAQVGFSKSGDVEVDESYVQHPKLVTLGGDHSVALPALRALKHLYQQPIAVVHFDAHLDVRLVEDGEEYLELTYAIDMAGLGTRG